MWAAVYTSILPPQLGQTEKVLCRPHISHIVSRSHIQLSNAPCKHQCYKWSRTTANNQSSKQQIDEVVTHQIGSLTLNKTGYSTSFTQKRSVMRGYPCTNFTLQAACWLYFKEKPKHKGRHSKQSRSRKTFKVGRL